MLAMPFKRNFDIQASEYNINYNGEKNSFEKLIDFIQEYADKRINITPAQGSLGKYVKSLSAANKINDNVYVKLCASDFQYIDCLKQEGLRFYFGADLPAYNTTLLESYISLGVSDIYPVDDLCYNLPDVSDYCAEQDVGLRLILNKIPSTSFDKGKRPHSPIFRPQDMDMLSGYFTAFEFDCGEPYNWTLFKVLHKAWFEKQNWIGNLSEINQDIQFDFPNASIVPDLSAYKVRCGLKCKNRLTARCRKCEQLTEIGQMLNAKGIGIRGGK